MSDQSLPAGPAMPLLPTARRGPQPYEGVPMRLTPPAAATGGLRRTESPRGRAGRLPTAALVLGIVSLVCNVLLLPTVLAIVFGSVALARGTTARGRSVVGIVLGVLGVVALGIQAAIAIPVFLAVQRAAVGQRLEASIQDDAASRGMALSALECPALVAESGAKASCTATTAAGAHLRIDVVFTDSVGGYRYRATNVG